MSVLPLHEGILLCIRQLGSDNFFQRRLFRCKNSFGRMNIVLFGLSTNLGQQLFQEFLVLLFEKDGFLSILLVIISYTYIYIININEIRV